MTELKIAEEKLGAMIRIPTVSKHEHEDLSQFYLFHKELERLFPLLHTHLEKTVLQGTLLYRWKGSDDTTLPILFMGHQDVVPATDEGWSVPAFSGVVKDGCLYGRGTLDCKGTMYVQLQAVEELLAEGFVPACDVYVGGSCTEEWSGEGAPAMAQFLKDNGVHLALLLDEGGMILEAPMAGVKGLYAMVGVVEKGYADVKFTARSNGGHASAPGKNTPLVRLGRFMADIEDHPPFVRQLSPTMEEMFRRLAPNMGFGLKTVLTNLWLFKPLMKKLLPMISAQAGAMLSTTIAFTMSEGSNGYNVIPQEASICANMRYIPHQGTDESIQVISDLAKKYGDENSYKFS